MTRVPNPCPISQVAPSRDFLAAMTRSISRNEKSIVARQVKDLLAAAAAKSIAIGQVDATDLFHAACHKRGAFLSSMLTQAGLRAQTAQALKTALVRGHMDTFAAQVDSLERHEPISAFDGSNATKGHLLAMTMLAGQADPLRRLLQKPVPLNEFKHLQPHQMPILQRFEVAQWLLSAAARAPTPNKAIDALGVLMEAGADPLAGRFGLGNHWVQCRNDRNFACEALSSGNLDLGLAMFAQASIVPVSQLARDRLGKQAACAILKHVSRICLGDLHLEDRHRRALQAIDAMGFPVPAPSLDKQGKWRAASDISPGWATDSALDAQSGLWLLALSTHASMTTQTDDPAGPAPRMPRL